MISQMKHTNQESATALHAPVMCHEAITALDIKAKAWYLDGTFGRGGHTSKILSQGGYVVALDHDQEAIQYGKITFSSYIEQGSLILLRSNFAQLTQAINEAQRIANNSFSTSIENFAGILLDFGTSVDQLTNQQRGFSFSGDGPLDMRMDDRLGVTAAQLLAVLDEKQLAQMFSEYGGEEAARAIARVVVNERKNQAIVSTQQLVALISRIKKKRDSLHPATKVFQALRIVVNSEIDNIKQVLPQALESLCSGGKLVTIAFHEGEDRVVKQTFKQWEIDTKGNSEPLQKPSIKEINTNPRSRSAKLRVFTKK